MFPLAVNTVMIFFCDEMKRKGANKVKVVYIVFHDGQWNSCFFDIVQLE